jgi:hypothetical protein
LWTTSSLGSARERDRGNSRTCGVGPSKRRLTMASVEAGIGMRRSGNGRSSQRLTSGGFAVANGDGTSNALDYLGCRNIGVCAPINEPYRIARDPILDLKTDPGVVRFMFDALRDFTGAILCKNVYWPAAAK